MVTREPKVLLSVRPRGGTEYVEVRWLLDSGVFRTLITEGDYKTLLGSYPSMKLWKNKVRFTPYASDKSLSVLGKVKLALRNLNGLKVKSMAYVVRGGGESLLGRKDRSQGIISDVPV